MISIKLETLIVFSILIIAPIVLYFLFRNKDQRKFKPELWDLSLMKGFSDFNNDPFKFRQSVMSGDIYLKYPNGYTVEFEEDSYLVTTLVGHTTSGISLIAFNKNKLIKSLTHL